MKKCVYCRVELGDERAVDVCDRCGVGIWGQKMFQAVKDNMDRAMKKGDLFQGSVGENLV